MNAYLLLAEKVFEIWKVPMSGREILARAYVNNLVPMHLHGKTQHKTLQARLSEDIRKAHGNSIFCRTKPGTFFLRRYLRNPAEAEFHARPRKRELRRQRVLTLKANCVSRNKRNFDSIAGIKKIQSCFSSRHAEYLEYKKVESSSNLAVWSFVIVYRHDEILTFRQGRYRENRDDFINRRSIGFKTMPSEYDRNLFTTQDAGVLTSGVYAAALDIDIPVSLLSEIELQNSANLEYYTLIENCVVGIICLRCPDWFEPMKRRLSINDLQWLNVFQHPNHVDDFDPWSRHVLSSTFKIIKNKLSSGRKNAIYSQR